MMIEMHIVKLEGNTRICCVDRKKEVLWWTVKGTYKFCKEPTGVLADNA